MRPSPGRDADRCCTARPAAECDGSRRSGALLPPQGPLPAGGRRGVSEGLSASAPAAAPRVTPLSEDDQSHRPGRRCPAPASPRAAPGARHFSRGHPADNATGLAVAPPVLSILGWYRGHSLCAVKVATFASTLDKKLCHKAQCHFCW